MSELSAIEKNTRQFLDKYASLSGGDVFDCADKPDLWLPALCLISAKTAGDINEKIIHLAEIFYLLATAFRLHSALPQDGPVGRKFTDRHLLLTGDLLYSQVYYKIIYFGLSHYLLFFTDLISGMHEQIVMQEYGQAHAMLYEAACFLGADAAGSAQNMKESEKTVQKWENVI